MELRNSLESVVTGILDTLLKGRTDICQCERCRLDMQAFALNHLPPRYIVSERGLTHSEMNILKDAQFTADIVQIVSEAVSAISARPRPGYRHSRGGRPGRGSPLSKSGPLYFNFPHLLGTVFINREMDVAVGAKISLLNEQGKLAAMADPSWTNPYVVHNSTMGIFTFWPAAQRATGPQRGKSTGKDFRFTLHIACKGKKAEVPLTVRAEQAHRMDGSVSKDNVFRIPPVFVTGKA